MSRHSARPAVLAVIAALVLGATAAQAQSGPVRWVFPDAWSADVNAGSSVAIQFGQPMDAASVEAALTVDPPAPGRFRWANPTFVELLPENPLLAGRTHYVELRASARDAGGQPVLTRDLTWAFTTAATQGAPRFSLGLPVQLVTPVGGRGAPVQPGVPRVALDCRLYALDGASFLQRYQDLTPNTINDIAVAGLPVAAWWTARVDASEAPAEVRPPAGTAPGLYVLEVANDRVGTARTLLMYSDFALVAKAGRYDQGVWLSRLADGTPVTGATVTWLNASGADLGRSTTDAFGVARRPGTAPAAFAVAAGQGQSTAVGLDGYWSSATQTPNYGDPGKLLRAPEFVGHAHTDRPIYRPGHTVHYKATLRRFGAGGALLPEPGRAVTATIRDATGNVIARTPGTLDAFGSVAGDLVLGDGAGLGAWRIEVAAGLDKVLGGFQVQEYVKPDFAVTVATDRPFYIRGDVAQLTVTGRYYFGQPAAGAEVTLRAYRGPRYSGSTPYYQQKGNLDATGVWRGTLSLPGTTSSERWLFEAEVMDATRRPVVESAGTWVHPAAFALYARPARYGAELGQPLVIDVRTTGHDGTPSAGRTITIRIQRSYHYGSGPLDRTETVVTGPDGTATLKLADLTIGWYYLTATARDDAGREVTMSSYAWVYDSHRPWPWTSGLQVTADRDGYAPGDTARLLIRSPVTTTALVTLERDEVYRELVVPVGGATTAEVPIDASFAPVVRARVTLWAPQNHPNDRSEATLVSAETTLAVSATDKRLMVTVAPDAATRGPGEEARFAVTVTDAAGQPVDAQISFALVDAAVLALAADVSGDLLNAFWGGRPATVNTYDGLRLSHWRAYPEYVDRPWPDEWSPVTPGTPGPMPTSPPGTPPFTATPGGATGTPQATRAPGMPTATAGAPGPGGSEQPATPRREFPDTAYWAAALETGPDGTVDVVLRLPDTLTTWKAIVRAVDRVDRAGQGEGELVVTKPIIADPALPRFAVQGDQFALDLLGRNYAAPGALDGTCSLEAPGLVQLDPGERNLTLPFNETRVARWSVVASELGERPVTARLTTPAGGDAIELPLVVYPFTVPERRAVSGGTRDVAEVDVTVPFDAVPAASSVTVQVTPGLALAIIDGVESLIGYPYGCVEQTMSRMLPNAVVGRMVLALDIPAPEVVRQLPEYMRVGLQKLYGYQNGDGSWGWWSGGGNLYITAYVLHGLTLAGQGGYPADPAVLQRGFAWLTQALPREPDPRLRAYAVFVLSEADRATAAQAEEVWSHRDELDAFGLAAVALALAKAGRADLAAEALDALAAAAEVEGLGASWPPPADGGDYRWRSMASRDKGTAMALLALARLRPESPLAIQAARWLMEHRVGKGWSTTQATAFAVLALTDYLVASGELFATYDWAVYFDDLELGRGRIDGATRFQPIAPLTVAGDRLAPGPHRLRFEKQGEGTLFYTVFTDLSLYRDAAVPVAADGWSMTLTRSYTPIAGRSDAGGWKAGDVVNVRLTVVTNQTLWYVLVEDMLPAGLEALNDALGTETQRPPGGWRWTGYERKEIRDEKVTFFASQLRAGTHTFDYPARAVTPGTFSARPAEAYAMYRPEVWARSASDRVTIAANTVAERPALVGDFDRDCRLTGFDAQLVAADWGADPAAGGRRDLTGDGRVTAGDIALAGGRSGAACGDRLPARPGKAGDVRLALGVVGTPQQYQTFPVELVLDGQGNVGAFEATVALPAGAFEVVGLAAGPGMPGARLLGPVAGTATVRIGGYVTDAVAARGETVLARLTLKALTATAAELAVTGAQVVTDRGGEYTVTVNGAVVSPEPWRPVAGVFLPLLERR